MMKTQAVSEYYTNSVAPPNGSDPVGEMDRTLDEVFALVNTLKEKIDDVVNGLVGNVSMTEPTTVSKAPQIVSGLIPNATQRMNGMIGLLHTMHEQMNRLR
jgi:hypothetical protein